MSEFGRLCARFGRFNLVGLMGAALQLVLLDLLMERFGLSGVVAAPIAVETAVLHNFFWHERFTWRDQRTIGLRQRAIRLWRFHAGNGLISLAGNTLLIYCLSHYLHAPPLTAAVTAIALCSPINFLVADCWVYHEPPSPPRDSARPPQPHNSEPRTLRLLRPQEIAKRTQDQPNPTNGDIKICNDDPALHFPNSCLRLKRSDVERKSSSISAPRRRPTPSPCSSKQYYYFGHRIRPRVRPLGRVSEATSGE